jgi:hypothetical protein
MFNPRTESPSWSQTVTRIVAWQLNLLETHYRTGFDVVEASLGLFRDTKDPAVWRNDPEKRSRDDIQKLEALALEHVQKGIAPPKEIYRVPFRDRIDWAKFPAWARPIDPEMFEGAGHEG